MIDKMEIQNLQELESGFWVALKLKGECSPKLACVTRVNSGTDVEFHLGEYIVNYNSGDIEKIVAIPLLFNHLSSFGFVEFSKKYPNHWVLHIGTNAIVVEINNDRTIKDIFVIEDKNERICSCDFLHELQKQIFSLNLIAETPC
jgi:hypothetical protein